MSAFIKHVIHFSQKKDGKEKAVSLVLSEDYSWFANNGGDGSWRQGEIWNYAGEPVDLLGQAPPGEKKFLKWEWDPDTFTLEIGKDQPRASHKKGEETYFQKWISLFDVKRSADFKISPGRAYSDGTALGRYELHGASNSFSQGNGYWEIQPYKA